MNKRILVFSLCALLAITAALAGCSGTVTVTNTQPFTVTLPGTTQTVTQPGTTVTTRETGPIVTQTFVGTSVIVGTYLGGGTIVLPGTPPITTVLLPTKSFAPTTVTLTYGTVTETTALTGFAPVIPHGATIEGLYGFCFDCHAVPAGHVGRIANQNLCMTCHEQGPILIPEQ